MDFLKNLLNSFSSFAVDLILKLVLAGIVLVVGIKLSKFFVKLLSKSRGMQKIDVTARGFITTTIKFALNAVVIFSAVAILGVPTASIIALIGSCGVAIGLALQGSLSNFAGGLMLLIFKPFDVDDYITTPDASGTVKSIGIFYTTLSTPDNVKVVIPNSVVSGSVISNTSAYETRRLSFAFTVAHTSDVDEVKAIMLSVIDSCNKILAIPEPSAVVSACKDNGVEITARCWVKSSDYWDVNYYINETIKEKFIEKGVSIPANKLDVNIINK
ncbi:MAG: mechanosensitive ion channel [Ruminococcaceae bacterium]|nr:mechanosensitive ion channel [Oscillospiraceae bacterium]